MIKVRSALLVPLLVVACSSRNGERDPGILTSNGGAPGSGATTTTGSTTTGEVPHTATDGASTTTGITLNVPLGEEENNDLEEDEVCAATSLETHPVEMEVTTTIETEVPAPVAIYVVLDNSLSMNVGASGMMGNTTEPTKWEDAVQAITDFVNDPGSEGVEIGIQYFHPEGAGDMPDECDGVAHGTPAVDVGPLPDNAAAVIDSLAMTMPQGFTPTTGALLGGTQFCVDFQAQNPDHQCIVVLVTDGQPNGCDLDSGCGMAMGMGGGQECVDPAAEATLTPIAADALTAGVVTFTVGMAGVTDDGFALLDAIAVAGGSDCSPGAPGDEACDVSETGPAGFLDALNTIRDTIIVTEMVTETVTETVPLPCQWEIPPPPEGEMLDPDFVNVVLSIEGAAGELLGRVPSEADCAAVAGGWYYDNPEDPTSILVCPQTCEVVTATANLNVQVQLGCETQIAVK